MLRWRCESGSSLEAGAPEIQPDLRNSAFETEIAFEAQISEDIRSFLLYVVNEKNADGFFVYPRSQRRISSLLLDRFSYLPALAITHDNTTSCEIGGTVEKLVLEVVNSSGTPSEHVHFAFRSLKDKEAKSRFFLADRALAEELIHFVSDQTLSD